MSQWSKLEICLVIMVVVLMIPLRNDLFAIPMMLLDGGQAAPLTDSGSLAKRVTDKIGVVQLKHRNPNKDQIDPEFSNGIFADAPLKENATKVTLDGSTYVPPLQLCTKKAPEDRWQVFHLWEKNKLHVLEAEILQPTDRFKAGGVNVLSVLCVISDEADTKDFGIRIPHWNQLVMSRMWNEKIAMLRCLWGSARSTSVRGVWFQEKGHMLGLFLQCSIPSDFIIPEVGFEFVLERIGGNQSNTPSNITSSAKSQAVMRMCPNKYKANQFNLAICTTSQFPNWRIGPKEVGEWLHYHRLAGVDHVFFRDRTRTGYGNKILVDGPNNQTLKPYVAMGYVTYIPGPYHPPFDWGSVYSDQPYTNVACYMRLRHAAKWIATVDIDELMEVQQQKEGHLRPQYLPDYLAGLPDHVHEVALMHCRLMTIQNGTWTPHGRAPATKNRIILPSGTMRNCRYDIPAGKSIGRVRDTAFSHVHFLYPSEVPKMGNNPPCAWRWHNSTTPESCVITADYPAHVAKQSPFTDYGSYSFLAGVNHAGGKWLNFRGFHGNATPAFINNSLNEMLHSIVNSWNS